VAIAPLYVEWSDGGQRDGGSSIHGETLNTPLPGDDPREQAQTSGWPAGVDVEEELLILAELTDRAVQRQSTPRPGAAAEGPPATPGGAAPRAAAILARGSPPPRI